jgi:hypothetical protein
MRVSPACRYDNGQEKVPLLCITSVLREQAQMFPEVLTGESSSQVLSARPTPPHELGERPSRSAPSRGETGGPVPQVRRPIPPVASPNWRRMSRLDSTSRAAEMEQVLPG